MTLRYKYITKSVNGDATTTYDLEGSFPVKFKDFYQWVLKNTDSFRICFRLRKNKIYADESIELNKNADGIFYTQKHQFALLKEIKNIDVIGCWANGGWGQMSYYCSLAEAPENEGEGDDLNERINKSEVLKVKYLGDALGYGHLMNLASALWRKKLVDENLISKTTAFIPVVDVVIEPEHLKKMQPQLELYDGLVERALKKDSEKPEWQTSMMQHFTTVE